MYLNMITTLAKIYMCELEYIRESEGRYRYKLTTDR